MEKQTLVKEICPSSTLKRVNAGALLVDVREANEIEKVRFDVPKIMYIPLSEFEDRFSEIPKDEQVVMVCKSGTRSLRAAGFLVNHGYSYVENMENGLEKWALKGFPILGEMENEGTESSCCSPTICC